MRIEDFVAKYKRLPAIVVSHLQRGFAVWNNMTVPGEIRYRPEQQRVVYPSYPRIRLHRDWHTKRMGCWAPYNGLWVYPTAFYRSYWNLATSEGIGHWCHELWHVARRRKIGRTRTTMEYVGAALLWLTPGRKWHDAAFEQHAKAFGDQIAAAIEADPKWKHRLYQDVMPRIVDKSWDKRDL